MKSDMYKCRTILLSALFVMVLSYPLQAQDSHEFSLQEAIDYALANNQNLQNKALDIKSAEGVVKENIATGLPQLNINIDLADNFELPTTFLPGEIFGQPGEEIPVQFGTNYSGNANLGLTQMIFDGVFFVGLDAAKTFKELSTKENIQTRIDVAEAVTKAYYNLLVNQLTLELIVKNYGRLDTLLNETRIMYESGFAEKIDVNRVKIQFNNIRVNRDNARNMLTVAEALLKFQMGMPMNDIILLTDELSNTMFEEKINPEFEYSNRIEYDILQTREQLAILDIKRTKVEYLPKLDMYANAGALAGTNLVTDIFDISNEWFKYGVFGIRMNIPIFDGLQKRSQIQQKKVALNQVANNFDLLKNSIDLELSQSKINYNNSVDFMNVQRENMDLSQEVYDVTKTKYQQGIGSNIEVINADADYKEAQTNFFTALYSALIAKVEYKKALGQLL